MKKRIISILLSLVLCLSLLPTMAFAAGYKEGDISGTTGLGTESSPVIVNTFAEFKAAMESWDISYVKLVATNEILPVVEQYQAAIMVAGPDRAKNLIIEGESVFRTRLDSAVYDSLLYVYYDQTLNVSGNGSLTFCPNGTNGFNCVVRNEGVCNISDVTLIGDIGGATVYALAVVNRAGDPSRGGELNITSGTYVGSTAMDGSGPYAAVRIVSGEAEISGGEFRSDIYPGITVRAGTNALAVEESASCVLTGGKFYSGINVKNKNIASILGEGYHLVDTKGHEVSAQQSRCDYASVKAAAKTITHLGFSFDIPNDGEEYPDGAKDIGRVTGCPVGVKVVDVETVQYNKRINGTAKAGDLVSFGIIYEVLPGYEIASSYTAAINGESALKVVTSDGVRKVAFENGVKIGYNPDITIQSDLPDTVSYTVGGSINASVSAKGSGLKYQWQLGTDSGKKFNTYKDIAGATSASLTIKNADASYEGKLLRCCVSNSNGNAYSKIATLKKVAANTVTAADVTIPAPVAGQKVSAHKVWTLDAPEKYTVTGAWTKGTDPNGAAMGDNETFEAGQKYTAALMISSKSGYTLADNFAVKVNGNSAVKYSGSATLQVWYYTFTCSGSTTITTANVTIPAPAAEQKVSTNKVWTPDAPEKYTVTGSWVKGTDPNVAAMGENETFVAGQKYTATLMISAKSGYTLADNFAVKVNGDSAVKYSGSATLQVWYYTFTCPASGAPVITAQPKAVTVKAGESATFTVTATGENLKYQWYAVDGGVPTKFATTATCTVKNVPLGYNGLNFYCVVSNTKGSVTSDQAKLTVLDPTYKFPFTDVKTTDWFYADVLNANKLGLINGKSATEYKPNDNMTYAEAVKLAACMNQLYTDGAVTLTNAASGMWYDSYYQYCRDKGIISAKGDAMNPSYDALYADANKNITREMYVYLFSRCLPKSAFPEINKIADNAIPDVPVSMGVWDDGVYLFYRAGILQGSTVNGVEHMFLPNNNIKRSEVAAILSRMMDTNARLSFTM